MDETMEQRMTNVEGKLKLATAQFSLAVVMGVAFWGFISKFVYEKLDSIDSSIVRIHGIDGQLNLIGYRQAQQDALNLRVVQEQEQYRVQVQQQFDRIMARIDNLPKGN